MCTVAACGDDDGEGPRLTATTTTGPPAGATTTLESEAAPLADIELTLTEVAEADGPSTFAARAGTDTLYIGEIEGRVRPLSGGDLGEPVLDISDDVVAGGEQGLLGLAFSPDGDTLYVSYSLAPDGDSRVDAYTMAGDEVDSGSRRELLAVEQPYGNHNGGHLAIGPDGHLYIGLGDGGSGGDPEDRAENPGTLLGKLLRIDVLGTDEGYRVPSDNPFVARDGYRPEILHLGLRNPWRTSLDAVTGDLWIADVGQSNWEEINVARAGAAGLDFGWNTLEGTHCFEPSSGCDTTGKTAPVAEYPHALGCSVTGGYVYRGAAIAGLQDAYLFGDYCSGRLWAIDAGMDAPQAPVILLETGRTIGSFGQDADAELYLLDIAGGELLRIVAGG